MIELGEKFLFGTEIAGAIVIGFIFIYLALKAAPDMAWKIMIAAVLCFCCALFFGLMYMSGRREREKKKMRF
jgi:hypothetical protein